LGDAKLVLEGKTKFIRQGQNKLVVYIPADLIKDSRFPFNGDEELFITVDPDYQSIFITIPSNLPSYRRSGDAPK
jgi:hypothetical protein